MGSPLYNSAHYATFISNNGSTNTYSFYAEWYNNSDGYTINNRYFVGTGFSWSYTPDSTAETGYYYTSLAGNPTGIAMDINMSWYPYMDVSGIGQVYGGTVVTRTYVIAATSNTPTSGSVTSSSALVSVAYTPNVSASTCTAQLQYKRTVDSTWINFGSAGTSGGFSPVSLTNISLTGLASSTSYDVRLSITRTTSANTTTTSSAASFSTLAGVPVIVTDSASGVAATSATLNATLTINAGTGVTVYWKWGPSNPPTENTTASQAASGDGSFSVGISGLTGGTAYKAQAFTAFSTPGGSPVNGSVVSFNTPADPAAEAAAEDHMHIYDFDGQYGAAKTVYFTLASPAATSSDRLVTTAPGALFAAGDIKVSKDGGAFANVANSVTQIVAANPLYSLVLSATEMQAEDLVVQIVDQNGPAFRDAYVHVRTKLKLGQIDVDASNLSNVSAMKLTGQGTGSGLEAVAGATGYDISGIVAKHFQRVSACQANASTGVVILDASANGTNNYYTGSIVMIVSGTGAGQARVITAYDGTTKEATPDTVWIVAPTSGSVAVIFGGSRTWEQTPSAELATVPGSTANYGLKLQFLFQRFAFKITQTATLQTWFKANSSTTLGTRSVDDNGVTQTLAKLT